MPLVGFKPKVSAGERPQTSALDRAATGTEYFTVQSIKKTKNTVVPLHALNLYEYKRIRSIVPLII